jgi:hypothetical protein
MRTLAGLEEVRWVPDADALRHAASCWLLVALAHVRHLVRRQRRLLGVYAHAGRRLLLLRRRRRDAEARALKAAQHPFLLAAAVRHVSALLRRDPARAEHAIVRLAEELRATASRVDEHEVSLEEELATLGRLHPAGPTSGGAGPWGGRAEVSSPCSSLLDAPVPHLLLPSLAVIAEAAAPDGARAHDRGSPDAGGSARTRA